MVSKVHAVTREQLVEKAYHIACEQGLESVHVRNLAAACGVAVGTIYNYFPTKAALLHSVAAHFWHEELAGAMARSITPGDDYVEFCQALFADVSDALQRYRAGWMPYLLAAGDVEAGTSASMFACPEAIRALENMRFGLERILLCDPRVITSRLTGELAPMRVARFTLNAILELAAGTGIEARNEATTFFALLRMTLYAQK